MSEGVLSHENSLSKILTDLVLNDSCLCIVINLNTCLGVLANVKVLLDAGVVVGSIHHNAEFFVFADGAILNCGITT